MTENCPMETVSGKLEIRVVDRHLNDDNYCDTTNSKPIVCFDEDDEGLF